MKVTLVDGRTLLRWLEVANGSTLVNIGDEAGILAELLVEQVTYTYLLNFFIDAANFLMLRIISSATVKR